MMTTVAGYRWMIRHGLCLAMMKFSPLIEYRASLGKAISIYTNKGIQKGLEARIEHDNVGMSLAELEAYDSRVASGYVSAVNELENVSFPILDQLEALKDSPLELLMSSLTLEGDHGEEDSTPEFCKLQLVSEQVTVPVYYKCSGLRDPDSISHEILLSDALAASHACAEKRKKGALLSLETGSPSIVMPSASSQETSLVVADYQISSVAIVDGTTPATKPHDDLFDTTILDKLVDH
uniref:Uncharacterized protein n=1 Tax=Tanacetum cinerariifolium TaxID=118510 RepID=A0A6L2NS25_TANCI|nr:hypothetical protein [Tanacetum cinerariifolium]